MRKLKKIIRLINQELILISIFFSIIGIFVIKNINEKSNKIFNVQKKIVIKNNLDNLEYDAYIIENILKESIKENSFFISTVSNYISKHGNEKSKLNNDYLKFLQELSFEKNGYSQYLELFDSRGNKIEESNSYPEIFKENKNSIKAINLEVSDKYFNYISHNNRVAIKYYLKMENGNILTNLNFVQDILNKKAINIKNSNIALFTYRGYSGGKLLNKIDTSKLMTATKYLELREELSLIQFKIDPIKYYDKDYPALMFPLKNVEGEISVIVAVISNIEKLDLILQNSSILQHLTINRFKRNLYLMLFILFVISFMISYYKLNYEKNKFDSIILAINEIGRGSEKQSINIEGNFNQNKIISSINNLLMSNNLNKKANDEYFSIHYQELSEIIMGLIGLSESLRERLEDQIMSNDMENIDIIILNTRKIQNILNNMSDFSKTHIEKSEINLTTLDLKELVETTLSLSEPILKNVFIDFNIELNENVHIVADEMRFKQLFYNLIRLTFIDGHSKKVLIKDSDEDDYLKVSITFKTTKNIKETIKNACKNKEDIIDETIEEKEIKLTVILIEKILKLHNAVLHIEDKLDYLEIYFKITQSKNAFIFNDDLLDDIEFATEDKTSFKTTGTIAILNDKDFDLKLIENYLKSSSNKFELKNIKDFSNIDYLLDVIENVDLVIISSYINGFNVERFITKLRGNHQFYELPILLLVPKNSSFTFEFKNFSGVNDFLERPIVREELLSRTNTMISLSKSVRYAIGNAKDYELEKHKREFSEKLITISNRLSSVFEIEDIITILIEELSAVISIDKFVFMLRNGLGELDVIKKNYRVNTEKFYSNNKFAIEAAIDSKNSYRINELFIAGNLVLDTIAIPIIYRDKSIGVLLVNSKEHVSNENANLLFSFTSHSAFAIENAKLFDEIINQKDELQKANITIKDQQEKLITEAYNKGLFEVLSGVIHNIGNIISSVYINLQDLMDQNGDEINFFEKILIPEAKNIESPNEKMKKVIEVLPKVVDLMKNKKIEEHDTILSVIKNVTNIREIIHLQQNVVEDLGIKNSVDISAIADEVLELYEKILLNKGVTVKRNYNINEVMFLEKTDLIQVLGNLIKNAFEALDKIKDREKIITVSTTKIDNEILISISDNGPGISEDKLEEIFEFGVSSKNVKGRGLGLNSCKRMVEKNGGILTVTSKVGRGTTFTIKLPEESELKYELEEDNNG